MFAGFAGLIAGLVIAVTIILPAMNWLFNKETFKSEIRGFKSYPTFRSFWVGWVTLEVFKDSSK